MQAYPKDSLNNVLGGSGPLNTRADHSALMGHHDEEAFKDYSRGAKENQGGARAGDALFDPLSNDEILHGDQTMGLGTSTFLEGTPAARTAIQKREEERAQAVVAEGLQRKKSLAHRIRNINRGPREFQPSGRMTNPEGVVRSPRSPPDLPNLTSSSMQAGSGERNPFFSEFEPGKKGEELISVRRTETNGSGFTSPSSPKASQALERRATNEGTTGAEESKQTSGLLARVKSLKGGRRAKPPPPPGDGPGVPQVASPAPGTAV